MSNISGSVILSWCYDENSKGVVIVAEKDPLSILSIDGTRTKIKNAWTDAEGLAKLKELGIDILH